MLGAVMRHAHSAAGLMAAVAVSAIIVWPAMAAPKSSQTSPTTQNQTVVKALSPAPAITLVTPAFGSGDTPVTIKGLGLSSVTAITFGSMKAGFTIQDANTIKAQAPNSGIPGSTVPVSAVIGGNVVATKATFSYPIAEISATGPLPLALGYVGDAGWASGQGHLISADPPQTLAFVTATPVLHVTASFVDDTGNYPQGILNQQTGVSSYQQGNITEELVGNMATYAVILQVCSLNGVPSFGTTDTHQPCTNFDNNTGTWVNLPQQTATLKSAGAGQTTFGDIAVPMGAAFDQANTARTFRLMLMLSEEDTRPTLLGNYRTAVKYSNAFNVVVSPSALIQLSVIPDTILYQPPGNQSTVSFTTSNGYGTNYSLGGSTEQSNTTSESTKLSQKSGISLAYFLGFSLDSTLNWDGTTQTSFGTTNASTSGGNSAAGFSGSWTTDKIPGLVPGSGETCISATDCSTTKPDPNILSKEPFWNDRFILFVHPQYAVWVLGGGNDRYVMYGAVPVTANASVAQLHACAIGQTLYGQTQCEIDYTDDGLTTSKGPIYYSGNASSIVLSKQDASNLLELDPFYSGGQGAKLPVTRAIPIASGNYGAKIGQPATIYARNFSNTQQTQQGSSAQQTNATTVSGVVGSDLSIGENFSYSGGGLTAKANIITLDNSVQTGGSNTIKTVYTDSTAVSNQQVTTAAVSLNDYDNTTPGNSGPLCKTCHDPLPHYPSVNIYLDRMFGSFMFQDPAAPTNATLVSLIAQCRAPLLVTYTMEEQAKQRFSDVPKDSPAHLAIGLLARAHLMGGDRSGRFHPDQPLTRGDLAAILTKSLALPAGAARKFTDLPATSPAASAARAAVASGLVRTRSPSQFGPKDSVSRQELAAAMAKGFHVTGGNALQPAGAATRADAALTLVSVLNAREGQLDAAKPACAASVASAAIPSVSARNAQIRAHQAVRPGVAAPK